MTRYMTFGEKEDLQEELKDFLRKRFGGYVRVSWHPDHLRISDEIRGDE